MPLFTYTATNDDNKEVRGTIESSDETSARKALEDLSLDVKEITEASRSHAEPQQLSVAPDVKLPAFAFEGKDTGGIVRRGTIQAPTKYDAFKRLRDDQKLLLTMLSPVGVLPQYKDADLDQWQRGVKTTTNPLPLTVKASAPTPTVPVASRPAIGFTHLPELANSVTPAPRVPLENKQYHPLLATLRLYAGWLLAWYGVFVALGYYSVVRRLPTDIPFVQAFYYSPLIFSFIIAIFLFLLLSALHKAMNGRLISGIAFTLLGIGLFVGVRMLA